MSNRTLLKEQSRYHRYRTPLRFFEILFLSPPLLIIMIT